MLKSILEGFQKISNYNIQINTMSIGSTEMIVSFGNRLPLENPFLVGTQTEAFGRSDWPTTIFCCLCRLATP